MNRLWPAIPLIFFCVFRSPAQVPVIPPQAPIIPAQPPTVKIHPQGLYSYPWNGIPHHHWYPLCDSANDPNEYFLGLPLLFFYADSTVALVYDYGYRSHVWDTVDPGYFARYSDRLSKGFTHKFDQAGVDNFGLYRLSDSGAIVAKMHVPDYPWNKEHYYFHFVPGGSDTLWLTGIYWPKGSGPYCNGKAKRIDTIKFTPALPFVFYPFPTKPDSSLVDFNRQRWTRQW